MPTKTKQLALTTTEVAVLGLLTRCPMSGYDLKKEIEGSVGYFWGPAKSQIYAVLPRLVEAGFATSRRIAQSQRPDKQVYRGRDALYSFFGGAGGRPGQMTMQWHHLAFDEKSQVGFGEFSFTYGSTVHGITVVRLRRGKIANWREYWYESPLPWDQFTRANPF